MPRVPQSAPAPAAAAVGEDSDSDDPSVEIGPNLTCRRRGCNVISTTDSKGTRDEEVCVHHFGQPLFHEGSKGWTCCKRRVLEFDEFMKIEGCKTKRKHLFVGSRKDSGQEEVLSHVR